MIEDLHDKKVNEILTLNYVLNKKKKCMIKTCTDKDLSKSQERALQNILKDCLF